MKLKIILDKIFSEGEGKPQALKLNKEGGR